MKNTSRDRNNISIYLEFVNKSDLPEVLCVEESDYGRQPLSVRVRRCACPASDVCWSITQRMNMDAPDNPPLLVMVSSVVDGYAEVRSAARAGIEAAAARPLMVNEDFPSQSASSRNVCLEAVAAAEVYAIVVGPRAGWTTPSGKLVVEEEFEEAVRLRKPVLAFIQTGTTPDEGSQRLAKRVSDYVKGFFRTTFDSPQDLQEKIETAVRAQSHQLAKPTMDPQNFNSAFSSHHKVDRSPSVRLVLTPERQFELIAPEELDSAQFQRKVLELAHAGEMPLLDYRHGKEASPRGDTFVVKSSDARGHSVSFLEIQETGLVSVETSVYHEGPQGSIVGMQVAEEDIEAAISGALRFCGQLYFWKDPYGRNQGFLFNCSLLELGYNSIQRNPQPRTSFAISMGGDGPISAYDSPRPIGFADLLSPGSVTARALVKLKRAAMA